MEEADFNKEDFLQKVYPILADGYPAHSGQLKLHNSPARFRTLACGARWGKTTAAAAEIMAAMASDPDIYWCVGPIYRTSNVIFKKILWGWMQFRPKLVEKYSESEKYLRLKTGAECYGMSADNPASLLSVGVKGMAIDEPAIMKVEIWQEFLQSRLNDKRGWALFTSTPKGKGWYWELYKKGKNQKENPDYFSMDGPVWDNPRVSKEWMLEQRKHYTERYWNQEVLGMFISDSGSIFRDIRNVARMHGTWNEETGVCEEPRPGEIYSGGADLAKSIDFTVISVLDTRGHLVYWRRLPHDIPYPTQRSIILGVSQKYNNCTFYVDSSGPGDPVMDDFKQANAPVVGIKTAQEKIPLIDSLAVGFENMEVSYPDIPILINELEIFDMEKSPTGHISYKAPDGFHDDAVISLALAWRGIRGGSRMVTLGGIDDLQNRPRQEENVLGWSPRF